MLILHPEPPRTLRVNKNNRMPVMREREHHILKTSNINPQSLYSAVNESQSVNAGTGQVSISKVRCYELVLDYPPSLVPSSTSGASLGSPLMFAMVAPLKSM